MKDGLQHVLTGFRCHVAMKFFTSIEKSFKKSNQKGQWRYGNRNFRVDFSYKEKTKTNNQLIYGLPIHSFSLLFSTLCFLIHGRRMSVYTDVFSVNNLVYPSHWTIWALSKRVDINHAPNPILPIWLFKLNTNLIVQTKTWNLVSRSMFQSSNVTVCDLLQVILYLEIAQTMQILL